MDNKYKGIIWTNHALDRLRERGVSQSDAWATWKNPDQSRFATTNGAWVYYKTYGDKKIEVVAKQNEKKEWVILSVWSKQNYEKNITGSKRHKKDSFLVFLLKKLLGMG